MNKQTNRKRPWRLELVPPDERLIQQKELDHLAKELCPYFQSVKKGVVLN